MLLILTEDTYILRVLLLIPGIWFVPLLTYPVTDLYRYWLVPLLFLFEGWLQVGRYQKILTINTSKVFITYFHKKYEWFPLEFEWLFFVKYIC